MILWKIVVLFSLLLYYHGLHLLEVKGEQLQAQPLRLGRELHGEVIRAPGTKAYVLNLDGVYPYEAVEVRISHLSIPPAKFSFSTSPFPADGSVFVNKRNNKRPFRRRRRLNTAITMLQTGSSGSILIEGIENPKTLLIVQVIPTGVTPGMGIEKSVDIRYNILMERKVINNTIPETAIRMIGFGILCLFASAVILVPIISVAMIKAEEMFVKQKERKT